MTAPLSPFSHNQSAAHDSPPLGGRAGAASRAGSAAGSPLRRSVRQMHAPRSPESPPGAAAAGPASGLTPYIDRLRLRATGSAAAGPVPMEEASEPARDRSLFGASLRRRVIPLPPMEERVISVEDARPLPDVQPVHLLMHGYGLRRQMPLPEEFAFPTRDPFPVPSSPPLSAARSPGQHGSPAQKRAAHPVPLEEASPRPVGSPARKIGDAHLQSPAKKARTPERAGPAVARISRGDEDDLQGASFLAPLSQPSFSAQAWVPVALDPMDAIPAAAGAAAAAAERTPLSHCQELAARLDQLVRSAAFDEREADALLQEIYDVVFSYRRENQAIRLPIYEPSFLFNLCELKSRLDIPDGNERDERHALRLWKGVFNTARSQMNMEQREALLGMIRNKRVFSNPVYAPFRETWNAHYLPLDPTDDLLLRTDEEVLELVVQRARDDLAQPPAGIPLDVIHRTCQMAERLLQNVRQGRSVVVDRVFHCTTKPQYVPDGFDQGVQVRHKKLWSGAFFGTTLDTSFGPYGLSASPDAVAVRLKSRDRIERRDARKEQGAVWFGVGQPVPVQRDRVVVTPESDQYALRHELESRGYRDVEFVDIGVQNLFNRYVREFSRFIPIPHGTHPSKLRRWETPPDS